MSLVGARTAVIGDVMLDVHIRCAVLGISPEDDVAPNLRAVETTYRPGGAGNVALNLKSMGVGGVTLFGVVGGSDAVLDDVNVYGRMQNLLRKADVFPVLVPDPNRIPTIKKRYVTLRGRHICRINKESRHQLEEEVRDELFAHLRDRQFDLIIVSDYAKGVVSAELMQLIREVHACPVLVDPKGPDFGKYGRVLAVTPNSNEYLEAVHKSHGERWREACQAEHLVITLGSKGCKVFTRDFPSNDGFYFPVRAREVGDPAGCGDSFIAGLACGILEGKSVRESCPYANAAGASAYDMEGVKSVTAKMVEEEMARFDYQGGSR